MNDKAFYNKIRWLKLPLLALGLIGLLAARQDLRAMEPTPEPNAKRVGIERALDAHAGDGTAPWAQIAQAGGPDAGGYTYQDSAESGGPAYAFEDISGTGTALALADDEVDGVPLPFDFYYYSQGYDQVYVSSNGWIALEATGDSGCCAGQPLPTPGNPVDALIAGWWEDLNPADRGEIYYETLGTSPNRRFIVQFDGVAHWRFRGPRNPVTFQFKLFEGTGVIEVHYEDAPSDGDPHSAGIESPDGSSGLQYYRGTGALSTPLAVRYSPPPLQISQTASEPLPRPGDRLTYTIALRGSADLAGLVISDTLPGELTFAGPVTLEPPQPGAILASTALSLPTLARELALGGGEALTLTLPVTVAQDAAGAVANVVTATAPALTRPYTASVGVVVESCRARVAGSTTVYPTVQEAVDAAAEGETVEVSGYCARVSTRAATSQVAYISKTLTLRGGYSPDFATHAPLTLPTTLDARGLGRGLYVTGAISPQVEHLHITGGDATGLGGDSFGEDAGGGIYVIDATATISACEVYGNLAGAGDGWGGGIYLRASASRLVRNRVHGNRATGGGGIEIDESSGAALEGNRVTNNTASAGGGLYLYYSAPVLTNTLLAENAGLNAAGALYVQSSTPRLLHSTLAQNTGGDGSGVYGGANSNLAFTNTILVSHTVGLFLDDTSAASLRATLWGNATDVAGPGSVTRIGDQSGNPAFAAPDTGDYRIGTASAAFDAGLAAGVAFDLDGVCRPAWPVQLNPPDLGAYENTALTVRRAISPTLTFGKTGARLVFTDTGTLASITVTLVKDYPTSQSGNRPLPRHYVITAEGAGPFTARLTVRYTQSEFARSDVSDESTLRLYRENGGGWDAHPAVVDTVNNVITATLVTGFSRWALGGDGGEPVPTAVSLAAFEAAPTGEGAIEVTWETAMELDNVGFNLYRSTAPDGPYTQLNANLIPAQYPGQNLGGSYTWLDESAEPGITYYYKLEDIDLKGTGTLHGPISTQSAAPTAVSLAGFSARGAHSLLLAILAAGILLGSASMLLMRRRRLIAAMARQREDTGS